jgi:hypothetical protein
MEGEQGEPIPLLTLGKDGTGREIDSGGWQADERSRPGWGDFMDGEVAKWGT